jgi:hypothetical protein
MYIVISIPKRKSIACGVSHFMTSFSGSRVNRTTLARWIILAKVRGRAEADHHELLLMIFMSRSSRCAASIRRWSRAPAQ